MVINAARLNINSDTANGPCCRKHSINRLGSFPKLFVKNVYVRDRRRTCGFRTKKRRRLRQRRILDISPRQCSFGSVPPFQSLVGRTSHKRRGELRSRQQILLRSNDGDVDRRLCKLTFGKKNRRGEPCERYLWGCQILHRPRCCFLIAFVSGVLVQQIAEPSHLCVLVTLWMRFIRMVCGCFRGHESRAR